MRNFHEGIREYGIRDAPRSGQRFTRFPYTCCPVGLLSGPTIAIYILNSTGCRASATIVKSKRQNAHRFPRCTRPPTYARSRIYGSSPPSFLSLLARIARTDHLDHRFDSSSLNAPPPPCLLRPRQIFANTGLLLLPLRIMFRFDVVNRFL